MNTDSNDNGDLLLIVAIVGCHYSLQIFCFLSKTEKKRTDERTYGRRKRERKRERERERRGMAGRSGRQGRLVPWSCWSEWSEVKHLLVDAHDSHSNARGLDLVSSWRARGRVPLSVEATAELVQIRNQMSSSSSSPSSSSSSSSSVPAHVHRLTLSMALVRLVNGVSGAMQKGVYAKSVANLAESAGLPRILVDVRHEATHNTLPSLSVLVIAAEQALDWLEGNYWKPQQENLLSQHKLIRDVLGELLDLCLLGGGSSSSAKEEEASTKSARAELLKEIIKFVHQSQASLLAEHVYFLSLSKPFRNLEGRGWKTFLNKICKYWPSLAPLVLERCWSGLKQSLLGSNSSEEKDGVITTCDFVPWMLENRDLWCGKGGEQKPLEEQEREQKLLKVLYSIVLEGARLAKGKEEESEALLSLLRKCFGVLSSSSEKIGGDMNQSLKILEQLLNPDGQGVSASGPDIVFGPSITLGKRERREGEGDGGEEAIKDGEEEAKAPRRWKKCKKWMPCAIGNLPKLSDPNGKLPFRFNAVNATFASQQEGERKEDEHGEQAAAENVSPRKSPSEGDDILAEKRNEYVPTMLESRGRSSMKSSSIKLLI